MYKKLKLIIIGNLFLSVLFLSIGVGIANESDNAVTLLGDYHIKINNIVDQKIKQVYEFFGEVEKELKANNLDIIGRVQEKLLPPSDLNEETCQENLSSTCLTHLFNQEYQPMAYSLIENLEELSYIPESGSITEVGLHSDRQAEFILNELKNARMASENTIEFYKQFLFAYPLHIQFDITAKNLQSLKGEIKKFTNILEDYPLKFHDATTVQCV